MYLIHSNQAEKEKAWDDGIDISAYDLLLDTNSDHRSCEYNNNWAQKKVYACGFQRLSPFSGQRFEPAWNRGMAALPIGCKKYLVEKLDS